MGGSFGEGDIGFLLGRGWGGSGKMGGDKRLSLCESGKKVGTKRFFALSSPRAQILLRRTSRNFPSVSLS